MYLSSTALYVDVCSGKHVINFSINKWFGLLCTEHRGLEKDQKGKQMVESLEVCPHPSDYFLWPRHIVNFTEPNFPSKDSSSNLVNKTFAFYLNRRFGTVFKTTRNWSWVRLIQSANSHPVLLRYILIFFSRLLLGLPSFLLKASNTGEACWYLHTFLWLGWSTQPSWWASVSGLKVINIGIFTEKVFLSKELQWPSLTKSCWREYLCKRMTSHTSFRKI